MVVKNENIGKKQVSINMIANIISYSSNLLISFILTPFLINSLGKEVYSFYPLANTIVSYMSIITTSLNTIASRFFTMALVKNDREDANKYFSSVLASNIFIGVILAVPMIGIVVFVDKVLDIPVNSVAAVQILFSVVFLSALVNVLGSVFGIATFAKNRIDLRSLRELITAIIRLALFVILYRTFPPSIIYVGVVAFIVSIINLVFQLLYTKYLLPDIRIRKEFVSKSHTFELVKAAFWNMVFMMGNVLLAGMNLVLTNIYYGASASGVLSIVQTVPSFINGVISMLVGVFFPVVTYKVIQNDTRGIVCEILRAERLIGVSACAVIIVFSAMAENFFALWVPTEDKWFLSLVSLITIMPHMIIANMWILTNLNIAQNKVKIPAIITILAGVGNVLLSFIASKILKLPFISLPIISTCLQILWVGGFMPVYASANLGIPQKTFYEPLLKIIICSLPIYVFIKGLLSKISLDNWVALFGFGAIVGISVVIILAMAVYGLKNLKVFVQTLLINKIFK